MCWHCYGNSESIIEEMKKLAIVLTIITLMLVANTGLWAAPKQPTKPSSKPSSGRVISKKDVFYFKFLYNKKRKLVNSTYLA